MQEGKFLRAFHRGWQLFRGSVARWSRREVMQWVEDRKKELAKKGSGVECMTPAEIEELTGFGFGEVLKWTRSKEFPAAVRLWGGAHWWLRSEVEEWKGLMAKATVYVQGGLMSQAEVGKAAGVSTVTVLKLIKEGRLPGPRFVLEKPLRWNPDEVVSAVVVLHFEEAAGTARDESVVGAKELLAFLGVGCVQTLRVRILHGDFPEVCTKPGEKIGWRRREIFEHLMRCLAECEKRSEKEGLIGDDAIRMILGMKRFNPLYKMVREGRFPPSVRGKRYSEMKWWAVEDMRDYMAVILKERRTKGEARAETKRAGLREVFAERKGIESKLCLDQDEVCKRTGLTPSVLWEWVYKGDFPRPISLGAEVSLWRLDDVSRYLERQREGTTV